MFSYSALGSTHGASGERPGGGLLRYRSKDLFERTQHVEEPAGLETLHVTAKLEDPDAARAI